MIETLTYIMINSANELCTTTRAVTTYPLAHPADDRSHCHGTGGSIPWIPVRTLLDRRSHSLGGDLCHAHPHKSEHRQHNQPLRYQTRHIVPRPVVEISKIVYIIVWVSLT